MSAIEVIKSAKEHWYQIRWNAVVEYKDEKYVICVEETPKGGERDLYYYDDTKKLDVGDRVNDTEIYEAIIERLSDSGCLTQSELYKGECFFEDEDDEAPSFNVPEFSKPSTEIPVFDHVPKEF